MGAGWVLGADGCFFDGMGWDGMRMDLLAVCLRRAGGCRKDGVAPRLCTIALTAGVAG